MSTKPFPALCMNCRHAKPEEGFDWNNRCYHPLVNAQDSYALANNTRDGDKRGRGSSCQQERDRYSILAPCGQKGRLWEPKPVHSAGSGQP